MMPEEPTSKFPSSSQRGDSEPVAPRSMPAAQRFSDGSNGSEELELDSLDPEQAGEMESGAVFEELGPDAGVISRRDLADEDAVDASLAAVLPLDTEMPAAAPGEINWAEEVSAQRVYLELKRVEDEVRALLELKDPVRKRKLGGTQRWRDLEDDILNWRFGGRFDEDTLAAARELIARRQHLFERLHFLAGTRPTWNT